MNTLADDAVLVNGRHADCVSGTDRGLLFGDGVFETLAVRDGRPRFWQRHLRRLAAGCRRLGLPPPDTALLAAEAGELLRGTDACTLKLIVTRGPGGRGYREPAIVETTRILQRHPRPDPRPGVAGQGARVRTCATRLGVNPRLAGIKHLNRLEQVLARREWDDPEIHEGLMLDGEGRVIGGTMSNLFAVTAAGLATPDLSGCGIAGITRTVVMELAAGLGLPVSVQALSPEALQAAGEVFLTNSLIGIWPVRELDAVTRPVGPLTRQLQAALDGLEAEGDAWRP